jgi:hypothetical protein
VKLLDYGVDGLARIGGKIDPHFSLTRVSLHQCDKPDCDRYRSRFGFGMVFFFVFIHFPSLMKILLKTYDTNLTFLTQSPIRVKKFPRNVKATQKLPVLSNAKTSGLTI